MRGIGGGEPDYLIAFAGVNGGTGNAEMTIMGRVETAAEKCFFHPNDSFHYTFLL